MKKFMSLLLVGIMMLSLVACGKSGGGKGELNVGVFYYTYSDTYISSVRTALDNALTEAGIKFQNYDGNSNQTTQNEQIDTAIAQGTNLLIVNIVTSGSVDASQAIVDKASAAGIPVIFFNRAVESDEDEGKVLGSYDKCAFVRFVNLLGEKALDAVIYATAVGECNAAMGRIVAAPTAGASGVLPGVLFALKKHCGLDDATLQRGMVVAGSIGMVINERASLAGAMGGCQAECGSAAAMAAGAAVSMLGGTPQQVGTAVAVVFKNVLGLVCDPVAGLVEVPCIKRNGACALQALLAAELALAGISSFINADEAIDAMKSVGDALPCALKETAGGGMAATPSAIEWAKKYFARK